MRDLVMAFHSLAFWGFIVVKALGESFADWSWGWVLLPLIPWLGLLVEKFSL